MDMLFFIPVMQSIRSQDSSLTACLCFNFYCTNIEAHGLYPCLIYSLNQPNLTRTELKLNNFLDILIQIFIVAFQIDLFANDYSNFHLVGLSEFLLWPQSTRGALPGVNI